MIISNQTVLIIVLTGAGITAFVFLLACLKARFCSKGFTREEREESLRNRRRIADRMMEDPEPDKDKEKPSDAMADQLPKPTLKKDEDSQEDLQNEARRESGSGNRKKVDLSGISGGYGDASILDDILEAIDELTESEEDESSDLNSSRERPLRARNDAKYVKTNQRKVRTTVSVAAQVHGRTRNREDPNNTRRNGTKRSVDLGTKPLSLTPTSWKRGEFQGNVGKPLVPAADSLTINSNDN